MTYEAKVGHVEEGPNPFPDSTLLGQKWEIARWNRALGRALWAEVERILTPAVRWLVRLIGSG